MKKDNKELGNKNKGLQEELFLIKEKHKNKEDEF